MTSPFKEKVDNVHERLNRLQHLLERAIDDLVTIRMEMYKVEREGEQMKRARPEGKARVD